MNCIVMNSFRLPMVAVVLGFLFFVASCQAKKEIIGKWDLVSSGLCAQEYADQVEFFENDKYTGGTILWNGGEYSMLDGNRIQMQTRAGLKTYDYRVSGDELIFIDSSHCEFKYRRAK